MLKYIPLLNEVLMNKETNPGGHSNDWHFKDYTKKKNTDYMGTKINK